jgi:hypothetical protein
MSDERQRFLEQFTLAGTAAATIEEPRDHGRPPSKPPTNSLWGRITASGQREHFESSIGDTQGTCGPVSESSPIAQLGTIVPETDIRARA